MSEKMGNFELMKLYDELDGIAWNYADKVATFRTKEAAIKFKDAAPSWTVKYLEVENE